MRFSETTYRCAGIAISLYRGLDNFVHMVNNVILEMLVKKEMSMECYTARRVLILLRR
jgi:hypothetical protein